MSTLLEIVAILCIIVINVYSAIITTPTSSDGTNQYFDTSTSNNYQFDTIICSTPNCHIICDEAGGCFRANINASLSDTLTITCNKNSACEQLTIIENGEPTTNFQLHCMDDIQVCSQANINIPTTTNVDIICNYTSTSPQNGACSNVTLNAIESTSVNIECIGDYSCHRIDVFVNNSNSVQLNANGVSSAQFLSLYSQNITNKLNISCGANSCQQLEINAQSMTGELSLECNDYSSCYEITLQAADMSTRYFLPYSFITGKYLKK